MNYEITENIEISAYEAMLTFDENVRQYANNDDFNITIYDLYTNTSKTITRSEFPDYGITDIGGDIANRAKNSFYEHGGLLMYFDSENKFYIKQLLSCKDPIDEETGFHSSTITIYFAPNKKAEFNTILLPKIVRSPYLVQVEPSVPDPVMPEPNKRQEFDYDQPVCTSALRVVTDYNAGDPNGIYVNTYNTDPSQNVPCYYSMLSAFTDTTFNTGETVSFGTVSSYLYDETTNESYPITYTSADSSASVRIPFADNYYTELVYYEFKQFLSADDDKLHKNKLVFDMNINGVPAPEVLDKLIITVDPTPGSLVLNKETNTGSMHVSIYNPNINHREEAPIFTITEGYTHTEPVYSEEDGTLSFDITGITFGDVQNKEVDSNNYLVDTLEITITASLDIPQQPCTDTVTKTWKYKKGNIVPLQIQITTFLPDDPPGALINDQTGTLVYRIFNPNSEFTMTGADTDTYFKLVSITGAKFSSDEPVYQVVASNTITITYTGITTTDSVQLVLEANLIGSNDDWDSTAIAEKTTATSAPVNYRHNAIILQPLEITFNSYVPAATDGYHWLTKDREDSEYPPIGSVIAEIYNPNEDYRAVDKIMLEHTKDPRGSEGHISYNFTQYASDGIVQVLYNNIELTREEDETWAELTSYLTYSDIQSYPAAQVKDDTIATGISEHWKYKVIYPDIHPYEDLAHFSLYSLSNLTLDGGKIGSKDIACRNLVIKNGAEVYSNVAVTSGCTVTIEGANNIIHGTISAEGLTASNPATFEQPIYIEKSLYLDNNDIPVAYTGANCNITLVNNSQVREYHSWDNPDYPPLPNIDTESFNYGTETIETTNYEFGINGLRTSAEYLRLKAQNNASITFYPGKYYFNDITIGENVTFHIKNAPSTDSEDNSVMIYTNQFAAGNNFHAEQDSEGPFDFRIYFGGTGTAVFDTMGSSMAGTIIAPNGTIQFNNYFTWVGHVWAKEVHLNNHASIDNNV